MIKVIIVDDEILVRVGVQSMLESRPEITVTGMASNGQQAFELISRTCADVVICDIRMPVLDGIELLRKCREELENPPEFILLTSYEDFSYAKSALRLGAADYLLKMELEDEAIVASIFKAFQKRTQRLLASQGEEHPDTLLREQRERFLIRLVNHLYTDQQQMENEAARCEIELPENSAAVICFNVSIPQGQHMSRKERENVLSCVVNLAGGLLRDAYTAYTAVLSDTAFCAVVSLKADPPAEKRELRALLERAAVLSQRYFHAGLNAGVSSLESGLSSVSFLFREAQEASRACFEGDFAVFYQDVAKTGPPAHQFDIALFIRPLCRAYELRNTEEVQEVFDSIIRLFTEYPPAYSQAVDACCKLAYLTLTLLDHGEEILRRCIGEDGHIPDFIEKLKNLSQILSWLDTLKHAICEQMETCGGEYTDKVAADAQQYILKNIHRPVSLREAAEALHLSPGYLGQIFKKHYGCRFTDYIANAKITEAQEMLKRRDMKIYEISESLGFENAYYFSRVFKKVTGMTPKEYAAKFAR